MAHTQRPKDRSEFNIAVICAVGAESDAVEGIFDKVWEGDEGFGKAANDQNTYTTGKIGPHNVVLVYMSIMGKVASASAASYALQSFPNIGLGLVVGICGAVPKSTKNQEIILGDVIISTGVVQFDFGRKSSAGLETKDTIDDRLPRSRPSIRSFLNRLCGSRPSKLLKVAMLEHLKELCKKEGFETHQYLGAEADTLFPPQYLHKHKWGTCVCMQSGDNVCEEARRLSCAELQCDERERIPRYRLSNAQLNAQSNPGPDVVAATPDPCIHFGVIASGDQIMRDASYRDQLAREKEVIAFETESAGTWDSFPTVVIKAVCDYADSHKSKAWQSYAAAVAAACMKAFLGQWDRPQGKEVIATPTFEPELKPDFKPELNAEFDREPKPGPKPEFDAKPKAEPDPNFVSEFWVKFTLAFTLGPLSFLSRAWTNPLDQYGAQFVQNTKSGLRYLLAIGIAIVVAVLLTASDGRTENVLSAKSVNQKLNPEHPIFAIIGKTGVGKSSFINVLGGRNESNEAPKICHGLEPCTNDVIIYKTEVDNSPIYLMDTPGFDDTRMTDKEVMEMIYRKLEELYRGDKLVKGLIYLHDITQPRVGGLDARQFRAFEQLLGVDRFQNLVFVITKWLARPTEEDVQLELAKEGELKHNYWNKMIERGSEVMRHDGSANSAKLIVMSLIYKPKIRLVMSPQEVQEKLNTLYNEPVNLNEEKYGPNHKVPKETPRDGGKGRKRPGPSKILWTLTRSIIVFLLSVVAATFVNEKKLAIFAFTPQCIVGNLIIMLSILGLTGLFYRWTIVSTGIFVMDLCEAVLLTMFIPDWIKGVAKPDAPSWFLIALLVVFPPYMTWVFIQHLPHTSDMYYF